MDALNEVNNEEELFSNIREGQPEMGGVVWSNLFMGGLKVNITVRALNPMDAIDEFIETLEYAKTKGFTVRYQPEGDGTDEMIPGELTYENIPEPKEQVKVTPVSPADPAIKVIEIAQAKITQQEADKWTLEMFSAGHKFADLKIVGKASMVKSFLKGVVTDGYSVDDALKVGSFNVKWIAEWKDGPEYAPGKHYKNVVSLRKA